MKTKAKSLRWVSRMLVVALILTALPLPAFAGETPPPPPTPRPTLMALVQQAAAVTPIAPAREQSATGATDKTQFASSSFFKKPAGIAVLAAFVAGVGFAIYSTQHDRVSSPGKK